MVSVCWENGERMVSICWVNGEIMVSVCWMEFGDWLIIVNGEWKYKWGVNVSVKWIIYVWWMIC